MVKSEAYAKEQNLEDISSLYEDGVRHCGMTQCVSDSIPPLRSPSSTVDAC